MPDEAKLKLLRRSKRCQVVKHGKFYLIGRFLNYLIQPIWYIHIVWKLEKNVQIFVANSFGESGENVKSKFLCNFFFVKCVKFVRRRQKSKNSTFSRRIRHWKICLHSAWKNSKFLVKLESEKFVYIFGRQFWFFLSDRIVEKIVYIRHEKKIQNFSSNWKAKNLFTFLTDNFDFFRQIRK